MNTVCLSGYVSKLLQSEIPKLMGKITKTCAIIRIKSQVSKCIDPAYRGSTYIFRSSLNVEASKLLSLKTK
jgi:hypothetical protein